MTASKSVLRAWTLEVAARHAIANSAVQLLGSFKQLLLHVYNVQNKHALRALGMCRTHLAMTAKSARRKRSSLDRTMLLQVRRTLRASVKDIIRKVGVTSILVTHDQEEAFDIADKVVIFNRWGAIYLPLIT